MDLINLDLGVEVAILVDSKNIKAIVINFTCVL